LVISASAVMVILPCSIPIAPNTTSPLVIDPLVIVGLTVVDVNPVTPPVRYVGVPPTFDDISVSVIAFAVEAVVVNVSLISVVVNNVPPF